MKQLAVLAIALASFAACKKEEKKGSTDTSSAKATETGAAKVAAKESGPFAGWDMAGRMAAFQGAHVTPGNALGLWEAWNVEGDKVTIWDGAAEKALEIKLKSPCEVMTTEKSDGGSSSTTSHFTLQDGKIVKGLGDAGSKKASGEAIACVSNKVFTVDAKGACTEWQASMFDDGKYEQKPGTCGFRKDGDKEVFAVTVHGYESLLEVHGEALLSQQLANTHSEKLADFAAAKAARDAKK